MAHDIRIVTEAELRDAIGLDITTIEVVEQAFAALAAGGVAVPPPLSLDLATANGALDAKAAHIPGLDSVAVAVTSSFPGNRSSGLPTHDGLTVRFSPETGAVETVFLDAGYLSALGKAAAGAVAARHLAPEDVTTAGVIGSGRQACLQMRAAHLVRPFARALIWGRDPQRAAACAVELAEHLGIEVEVTTDPRAVIKRSQLVVTATSARAPLVEAGWLHKELHLTAIGADRPGRNEVAPEVLARADLLVCDRVSQCELAGEFAVARAAGLFEDLTPPELGDIVTGAHPGRRSPADITFCDLTGIGAQDAALAAHALHRLAAAGAPVPAL